MILLFSGGLDSYIAWHYLDRPKTLYCNLGHRYAPHELETVKKLIPATIIDDRLNLADWELRDATIPHRNVFLAMIASHYDKDVILVVQQGEMEIPDRSVKFFNEIAEWIGFLDDNVVTLSSPFFKMTKTEMVKWYIDEGLDVETLISTRSCFSPGDFPCGDCAACFRRWVAFTNNDIEEHYVSDITKFSLIQDYIFRMKQGEYDPKRTDETFRALTKAGVM